MEIDSALMRLMNGCVFRKLTVFPAGWMEGRGGDDKISNGTAQNVLLSYYLGLWTEKKKEEAAAGE